MRKVLSVILALTLVICAWGCSPQPPQNPSDEQTVYYNVTFKQDGYDDVVKRVESGKGLSEENIPVPHDKTGYTVVWEEVDLSCITADIVVYAVETVNEYTIYLLYYPPQSQKETIEQTMPTQINELPEPHHQCPHLRLGYGTGQGYDGKLCEGCSVLRRCCLCQALSR